MRYLLAMIFAVVFAAGAAVFLSLPVASYVVGHMQFRSSDDVSTTHDLVYMGVNLGGLIAGWLVGWALGGLLAKPERPI